MKQLATLLIGASLAFASCKNNTDSSSYFDTAGMDTSVHPGDNFFMYANGTWIKNSVIPDDQSGWGSFYTLYDENLKKMRTILDELSAKSDHKPGSNEQKVGDFYASGMDTAAIEKAGYDPLKPMLAKIDAVKDHKELISLLATSYTEGDGALIGIYVGADERNSAKNILSLYQTGLTLPEKDYYTKTDAATAEKREKLIEHITNLFVLTGVDKTMATQQATAVLKLETAIAASHLAPVELRDPIKNYNKMSVTDLQKMSPNINWSNSLQQMGIQTDSVNVAQPAYYKTLSALLASQSIDVWKSKVKFDYISSNASLLSKAFVDERFSFNKLFSGAKTQEDRWKKMVNRTDNGLKDLLGQIFVQKYFPGEAKKRMD